MNETDDEVPEGVYEPEDNLDEHSKMSYLEHIQKLGIY